MSKIAYSYLISASGPQTLHIIVSTGRLFNLSLENLKFSRKIYLKVFSVQNGQKMEKRGESVLFFSRTNNLKTGQVGQISKKQYILQKTGQVAALSL